jgi:hypothetical protein
MTKDVDAHGFGVDCATSEGISFRIQGIEPSTMASGYLLVEGASGEWQSSPQESDFIVYASRSGVGVSEKPFRAVEMFRDIPSHMMDSDYSGWLSGNNLHGDRASVASLGMAIFGEQNIGAPLLISYETWYERPLRAKFNKSRQFLSPDVS